jgi:hypothetical protein
LFNIPNVTLTDQDTGVVDRFGKTALENLGLETTLQEVLNLQREHVIEAHTRLVKYTNAHESANERVTLEEPLRVLIVKLEQFTSCTADLGKDEGDTPNLALVAQAVLAGELP